MSHLEGKVAVIAGANSGIGLATAKRFLAEGAARVYVTARRQAERDKAVAALNATDTADRPDVVSGSKAPRAVGVQGDVTKPADMARPYERVTGTMLAGQFAPQFPVELIDKDFGCVLREVSGAAARGVLQRAIERGLGSDNMTGLVRLFQT